MAETLQILNIALPIFYALTLGVYLLDFFREKQFISHSKRVLLFFALLTHCFYLIMWTIEFDHTPITSKFEIFSLLACTITFSYFLLELLTDIRGTGAFIIFFSLLFQIVSSIFIEYDYIVPEILRNRLLGIHVISAIFGYSGITISAVYGVLFLLLYKNLKADKFGLIFNRLPNLEILEKLSFYSLLIGFVLLTTAIIIGVVWLPSAFPNFSYADPKLVSTGFVWIIYGAGIVSKILGNWYGKKIIIFSLCGFVLAMVSLILTSTLANTFHAFY